MYYKNILKMLHYLFKFNSKLIFSSIIAALGLIENSSVILVASMLVSPLMVSHQNDTHTQTHTHTVISLSTY